MNIRVLYSLFITAFILIISSCQDPVKNISTVTPSEDKSTMENNTSVNEQDKTVKIYDKKTLLNWKERYSQSNPKIFRQLIKPVLTPNERNQLTGVQFDVPELGKVSEPMAFYRPDGTSKVVMSAQSLKFLDDLCTAYAWLNINGYSPETLIDYIAMLRYKNLDEFPTPLDTLQIPKDALEDTKVDDLALNIFTSARTFILAHELGHILHNHIGHDPKKKIGEEEKKRIRKQEIEADQFALDILDRIRTLELGITPIGIVFFFQINSHLNWDNHNSTHPLSSERLQAVADREKDTMISSWLKELAELLADKEAQQSIQLAAQYRDFDTLAPRRRGELPFSPDRRENISQPFQGSYSGNYTRFVFNESEVLSVEVYFQRNGSKVTGRFDFGLGDGIISGDIEDNILYFDWRWYNKEGMGELKTFGDNQLKGTWGYRSSYDDGGEWELRRK